jgi:hypothetical protein
MSDFCFFFEKIEGGLTQNNPGIGINLMIIAVYFLGAELGFR